MKDITLLLCFAFGLFLFSSGQEIDENKLSLDSGNIGSQFDYVIEKSNRYQEYKVVKMAWLETLKSHVVDSIDAMKEDLSQNQVVISELKKEIGSLKATLKSSRDSLAQTTLEKDSITFINAQISKGTYKSMMWSLAGGLLLLLVFFIYKFNNSNSVTVETLLTLEETKEEYESFKKRAREREQVLKRELQDELNKQERA